MKKWTEADFVVVDISETASGEHTNKYEGIDGVDATGEYNKYINQKGTGTFTVPTNNGDNGDGGDDIVNGES